MRLTPDYVLIFDIRDHAKIALIIEDEPFVLAVFVGILKRNGFVVLPTADADAALLYAADLRTHIDLVIADVVLPGASGSEAVLQIRDFRPDLPVLFTSGTPLDWLPKPDCANIAKLPKGSYSFLQKPFTSEELMSRVRELLCRNVVVEVPS